MADLNVNSSSSIPASGKAPAKVPAKAPAEKAPQVAGDSLSLSQSKATSLTPEAPKYTAKSKAIHLAVGGLAGGVFGGVIGLGAGLLFGLMGGGLLALVVPGAIALVGAATGATIGYGRGKPKPGDSLLTKDPKGDKAAVRALDKQLEANAPNPTVRQRLIDKAVAEADSSERAAAIGMYLAYSNYNYVPALDKGIALADTPTQTLAVADFARKLEQDYHKGWERPSDEFYTRAFTKASEQTKSPAEALEVATQAVKVRQGVGAIPALTKALPALTDFNKALQLAPYRVPIGVNPEQSAAHLVLTRALELAKTPEQRKQVAERAEQIGDSKLAEAAK